MEVQGSFPIFYVLLYKTKLGLGRMKLWSKKHPRVFLYLAYFCIFVGTVGMIGMFALMFWQLGFIIEQDISTGGGLVLPIQTEKGLDSSFPVFYVPFWYWLIALFILVIVHEFAHGVIAERFNIRIKSSGLAFFGLLLPFIPGAFVEPDEKQLKEKKKWQQIAVYGAGSASNFVFGFLFLALWILAGMGVNNVMEISEIRIDSVDADSGLNEYGVTSGTIVALNGKTEVEEIYTDLRNLSPNETVSISILDNGIISDYSITTLENQFDPNRGRIGITLDTSNFLTPKEGYEIIGPVLSSLTSLFYWVWLLNIMIGLFNLLPIWITDGGQIFRAISESLFGEKVGIKLYNLVSNVSLILIIFTIWPSLLINIISLF